MKRVILILILFLCHLTYAQNGVELELRKVTNKPIYSGYNYQFDLFLTNELSDVSINIPEPSRAKNVRHIIQYEYSIFDSNDNIIYGQICRVGEGGRGSGNCPPRSCSKGSPVKLHNFKVNFREVGQYQVRVKYFIKNEAPHNFTNLSLQKTFNIDVLDEPRIPLKRKAVSRDSLHLYNEISDFEKMRDSTEVIKVGVEVNQMQLNGLVKYKNLREVRVWGENIDSIPSALFDLDLRLLSISFSEVKNRIVLPKEMVNLESLSVKSNSEVVLEKLSDKIEYLYLENCSVNLSGNYPEGLINLSLKNVKGNFPTDFTNCIKTIQIQLINYDHVLFQDALEGPIKEILLFDSKEVPEIRNLSLSLFTVEGYNGEDVVNIVDAIVPDARVRIPKVWKKENRSLSKSVNVSYY